MPGTPGLRHGNRAYAGCLHEAHVDAIHEWAERAKTAEKKLAALAEQRLTDMEQKMERSIESLKAALAEPVLAPAPGYCKHCKQYTIEEPLPAEPVQEPPKPAPLKRGTTGRCTRKVCECEKEGLGLECIYLEPVQEPVQDGKCKHCVDGCPACDARKLPVQEPVAWRTFDGEGGYDYRTYEGNEDYAAEWAKRNPRHVGWVEPLYPAPPQRKPLTEEEIDGLVIQHAGYGRDNFYAVARAIERAHNITGDNT